MRTIALEEHFVSPGFLAGPGAVIRRGSVAALLDRLPVSPADRERIAHGNAERLLPL